MSSYTKVTDITHEQYLQLEGLLTLAKHHRKSLEDIEKAACEITGEKFEGGGHTGDAMFEDYTAQVLLDKLDIKVAENGAS